MALITDLPASTTVASTDVFIKDTGSATQKITGANAADGLLGLGSVSTTSSGVISNPSSGITIGSQAAVKYGKVVVLSFTFYGTINAGTQATFSIASGWRPAAQTFGCGYYSQTPLVVRAYTGGDLYVRNASGTNRTAPSTDPFSVSVTYVLP